MIKTAEVNNNNHKIPKAYRKTRDREAKPLIHE